MLQLIDIQLRPYSRGFHLVTSPILDQLPSFPNEGLLHLLLQHTSAGLFLNENADPSVRVDFESYFDRLAPENEAYFTHTYEGPDDMPAHLKSAITGVSLTLPIRKGQLALGTWQGIYLAEFRNQAGARKIVATLQT